MTVGCRGKTPVQGIFVFFVPVQKILGQVKDLPLIGLPRVHLGPVDLPPPHQHNIKGAKGIGASFYDIVDLSLQQNHDFQEIVIVEFIAGTYLIF